PAGRGARAGVSAGGRALCPRAGFRRSRPVARRPRDLPPDPRGGSRVSRVRARRAAALGTVGTPGRTRRREVPADLQRGRGAARESADVREAGTVGDEHHAGRGRLRRSARARPRAGAARSGGRNDLGEGGARGVRARRTDDLREREATMRLAGKVAVISGGARGMGAAEARMFAREGASVVIGDILGTEGRAAEADIKAKGGEAVFVRLDVTSE